MTNIRASLGELCLRKAKGTWAPSTEALRAMLQQKKFTDLSGTAEQSGDLKSVVLHSMTLASVKSDFDVPLGVKVSGVDNSTYSLTGEAFSTVVAPKTESNVARVLQKDDVALGKFAHAAVRSPQLQAYHRVACSVRVHSLRIFEEGGCQPTPPKTSVLIVNIHCSHICFVPLCSQFPGVRALHSMPSCDNPHCVLASRALRPFPLVAKVPIFPLVSISTSTFWRHWVGSVC